MPAFPCDKCGTARATVRRPVGKERMCQECFLRAFEDEVHQTIVLHKLFTAGETVALGASGGKDSTVLAYVMKLLNDRHGYGLNLHLLSIDEGITGYRDDSLKTVERNKIQYDLPLQILSYEQLYEGWSMDKVVATVGRRGNCTYCGVFRRQALDRGAALIGADKVVTGHNADDIAETVLLNLIRGDVPRLQRCTSIITGTEGQMPRCKPFKYIYEKEIVMYAYFRKLDYFSTECTYSPGANRGHARELLKKLEAADPLVILNLIHSGESFVFEGGATKPQVEKDCEVCGYRTSGRVCQACTQMQNLGKMVLAERGEVAMGGEEEGGAAAG